MEGGPPRPEPWDPITQGDVEDEDAPPAEREAEESALEEEEENGPSV
jgi:hypothetical protein